MLLIKRLYIAFSVVVFAAAIYIVHEVTTVPEVKTPIVASNGVMWLDGGSTFFDVKGADGKVIHFSMKAVSGQERRKYTIEISYFPSFVPIPYSPPLGGSYERALVSEMERWSEESHCESFNNAYSRIGLKSGLYPCKELGLVYHVYSILRNRAEAYNTSLQPTSALSRRLS